MELDDVIAQANQAVLGKEEKIRLSLACLLAGGHLLIEDLPGVGKTTLAKTLAHLLGLEFSRIQFTSDMLPADVLGISVFHADRAEFRFLPGPVFSQVLLADEINRATPKTQSALLEAMAERQVTSDGQTRRLPEPFFVVATQNPSTQIGTYPLPESQLDRFLMRLDLGYPDAQAERILLKSGGSPSAGASPVSHLDGPMVLSLQAKAKAVYVSDALLDYLQGLLATTRQSNQFIHGLSPRAGLGLLSAAKAYALIRGRDMVLPEDVQAVLASVARHRLKLRQGEGFAQEQDITELIQATPLP